MEAQRKLLDSLMGSNRNGQQKRTTKKFTDADVCKNFLCGLCPSELLSNTKSDVSDCRKKHSEVLKQDYEEEAKKKDYGYEKELMKTLKKIIEDCDRKIEKSVKKQQENLDRDSEAINAAIKELIEQAEVLGDQGDIEGAREAIQKAEDLKKRKSLDKNQQPHSAQQERLRACDVCGAFLSIFDSNRRLADHFGGKMHIGFMEVRKKYAELVEKFQNKPNVPEIELPHNREYYDRDAPVDRYSSRDSRSKRRWSPGFHERYGRESRERPIPHRDREREYWDRDRDFDREREYWDRDRDFDRDREHWDRDREREYWDRDREYWDRDREREYWDRDRDFERDREHWDRDRHLDRWDRDREYWDRDRDFSREKHRNGGRNKENYTEHRDSPKSKQSINGSNEQLEKIIIDTASREREGLEEGEI